MHLVEQCRDPLHFVQDDKAIARNRPQLRGEQRRIRGELLESRFVEEIDDVRFGEGLTNPGGLPSPAHPEQEEAASWRPY